jgi:hypothetical protein
VEKMIANSLAASAAKPPMREYKPRPERTIFMYTHSQPCHRARSEPAQKDRGADHAAPPTSLTADRAECADGQREDYRVHVVYNDAGCYQKAKIAHLKKWIIRVSEECFEDYCPLLCKGIAKFLELDLLRYGSGEFSGKRGFGVVRQPAAILSFIESEIQPANLRCSAAHINCRRSLPGENGLRGWRSRVHFQPRLINDDRNKELRRMEAILKPLEAGAIDYIGELTPVVECPPRNVRSMSTGGRISVNDIAARLSIGRATVYAQCGIPSPPAHPAHPKTATADSEAKISEFFPCTDRYQSVYLLSFTLLAGAA